MKKDIFPMTRKPMKQPQPQPIYHLWVRLPNKPNERIHSYTKENWHLAVVHAQNYNNCYGSGTAWVDHPNGRYWP